MSYENVTLINLVETLLGQPLPSEERAVLEACNETPHFIRTMCPVKNQTARITSSLGQLILAADKDGSLKSLHRVRTTGNQYRCALQPLKKPTTLKLVVVTNLDATKKTKPGVWAWDFTDH